MKRRIIKVSPFTGGKVEVIEQDATLKFRGGTYTVKRKCYRCVDTGREFTDDAQDTDLMWALFRAYWERKGFEHFYDIDGYRKEQEPASEDLEKESDVMATKLFKEFFPQDGDTITLNDFCKGLRSFSHHFAQWQREQMMKDAIHCKVFWHDGPLLDYTQEQQDNVLEKIGAEVGDKVKLIIVKDNDRI